jgi:hypothetical protein
MKISTLMKTVMVAAFSGLLFYNANATLYTAVSSGNWRDPATWGGSVPPFMLMNDQIVIPSAFTVNVDTVLGLRLVGPTSSVTVNGTMTGVALSTLEIDSGTFAGNGTLGVGHFVLHPQAHFTYTGTILVTAFRNEVEGLTTTCKMVINQTLVLAAGSFTLLPGATFDLTTNSSFDFAGGEFKNNGGTLGLTDKYHVIYQSGSATTGDELSGTGLQDVTINLTPNTNTITLGSDVNIFGTLNLINGDLDLNGHALNLYGDLADGGTGKFYSNDTSDLMIYTHESPTSVVTFSSAGNTIRHFRAYVDTTNGVISLGSDLHVTGEVQLLKGWLNIGDHTLALDSGAMITNATPGRYIIMGSNGHISWHLDAANRTARVFECGTSDHYAPISVLLNGTGDKIVSVGVMNDVRANGSTGVSLGTGTKYVNSTWNVSGTPPVNMDLAAMWMPAQELNGFDRSVSRLSYYGSSGWDITTSGAATSSNGVWSISRNGVSNFGTFAVFDNSFTATEEVNMDNSTISLYPNPATTTTTITSTEPSSIEIVNVLGEVVYSGTISGKTIVPVEHLKNGTYFVRIAGERSASTTRFVKM